MENKDKTDLLLETYYKLINAIMNRTGDSEHELRYIMAENIKGFGTGKHEIFNNCDEYIKIIHNPFKNQLPMEAQVHFLNLQTTLTESEGIVHGPYEIRYMIDGNEKSFHGRRTVVFKWMDNRWRAIHLHASEPSVHLTEGESWPVQALKALNEELKNEVNKKTEELSRSLSELKATQEQLVYSSKMASLGELTAGIAHEIQNPLNFINNFSDVNSELIDELLAEMDKGKINEAKSIAKDIRENEQKIVQHGQRADGIVKSMLQHSRTGSGKKELTDINALCDEYSRLAYHGLKAKDKIFSAGIVTDFDKSIGNLNIVAQDIGRVVLNILNNAFYAVMEKKEGAGEAFKPLVSIHTKKINGSVMIQVKDNGKGIPKKILDKIFQPFFTTKPAGQGTGLGLSLSYDIIKAHGGELKVITKEGEGSEFIIQLPLA